MKNKVRKRISVLVIAFVLVIGTVIPGMMVFAGAEQGGDPLFETADPGDTVILVNTGSPESIEDLSLEGEIVDHYGQNVLMRTDSRTARELESEYDARILDNRNEISVKGHTFDTNEGFPELNYDLKVEEYESGTKGMYIVDMMGPVNPEWREAIEDTGAEVFNYQPNYAYEVIMTPEQAERVEDLEFVEWVGVYQPEFKLHSRLDEAIDKEMPINIRLKPGYDMDSVNSIQSDLDILSAGDLGENGFSLTADVDSMDDLENLALDEDVYYISPYVEPELHAEIDSQLIGGGAWFFDDYSDPVDGDHRMGDPDEPYRKYDDKGAYINQVGYTGEDVTITLCDTGLDDGTEGDAGHPDFDGRVIGGTAYDDAADEWIDDGWDDGHGHGTHVAGSAAGDTHGGTGETMDHGYYKAQGLAYDADIFVTNIDDGTGGLIIPEDYGEVIEEPAQRSDAYIHSNSWGAGTMGEYIDSDSAFDARVRDADRDTEENREMIVTASAGNDGGRGDYDQEIGSPGNAKNIITVGGVPTYDPPTHDNPEEMYGASSRGWTEDNRVKPDVVASAEGVTSTMPGAGHGEMSGTSMSNPAVAGAATVVVDWYEDNYDETPSPAMVKSIIINTANEMDPEVGDTGHIPNRDEGWGIADISKLEMPEEDPIGFMLEDQESVIETGDMEEYSINYQDEDEPLKITLGWTDKEAEEGDSAGGTPTLKNNLDLEVESPGGEIYRGNAFDETGDGVSDSGFTYPDTEVMEDFDYNDDGWDDVNNINNVYIHPDELESGTYTVRVHGTNVPEDGNNDGDASQDYALAAYNVPEIDVPDKEGEVMFERDEYGGDELVNITLSDVILEDEGTYDLDISSLDADGYELENKTVTLDEEAPGHFEGSIELTEDATEDGLYVEHDGEIIGWYYDEDPGHPDDLAGLEEEIGTLAEPQGEGISVAVIDETDYFDGETASQLEDRLPEEYTVDTLEADELIDEMENYDAFVPWRFGSDSLAQDFLDELDGDQGTVYLDGEEGFTAEGYPDAIERLYNVREDPDEYWGDSTANTPIEIEIYEDHDIFEGVGEEGDVVELLSGGTVYGSHYDGYSGEDLAEVRFDGTDEGQGVGIDEDNNEILLSAKNIDFFAEPDDDEWTEESWTLFANAVEFVSADREVQIDSPSSLVNSVDAHPVEIIVSNQEEDDETDVPVDVTILDEDDEEEYFDETTVDVNAEEEKLVEFEDWEPSEEGDYSINSTAEMHGEEYWVTMDILVSDIDDVGTTEILSPEGSMRLEDTHEVEAEVENFGTVDQEDVPVEAEIEDIVYLVNEAFDEEIPDDWTVDNTSEETWHWDDPASGTQATVDATRDEIQEEWLITPTMDATDADDTWLEIDHDLNPGGADPEHTAEIKITNDDGDTWELIEEWDDEQGYEGVSEYDISTYADGEDEVQVAFVWHTNDDDDNSTFCNWDIFEVSVQYLVDEYSDTTTTDIDVSEPTSVSFADWDPSDIGDYLVNISTDLDEDEDPTNDYQTDVVTITDDNDIGVDEIINPEDTVWEETQPVNATVSNYGDYNEEDVPIEATIEEMRYLLKEEFEEEIPDDWTVDDTASETWQWDETFGGDTMATVDVTRDEVQDEWLITPTIDTSDADGTILELDHDVNPGATDPEFTAEILITTDEGDNWDLIEEFDEDDDPTGVYEFDISDHADGEDEVQIAFVWTSGDDDDDSTFCNWDIFEASVKYHVEDYSDVVDIDIDMEESKEVDFQDWTPSDPGYYLVNISAQHPDEDYPENSTVLKEVYVREIIHDLEAVSIDSPEEPIYQYEEEVLGTVMNVGNRDMEEAPVQMNIDQVTEEVRIDEDFSEGLPDDWEVVDKDGNDNTWEWNEDSEAMQIEPVDEHENDLMWTSVEDCTDGTYRVFLEFYSEFEGPYDQMDRELLISTDGGETSQRIGRNVSTGQYTLDISQWASEEDEVMIGWEFYSEDVVDDAYWSIDDVSLVNEYITEEYESETTVEDLEVGEEEQVQFANWTPDEYPSSYLITMTTMHEEDDNEENIEISERVFVDEYHTPEALDPSPYDGEEDVTHSPKLNVTVEDPNDYQMDVTFYLFDEDDEEVGNETFTDVQSGDDVEAQFILLDTDSTFTWHVEMDDGVEITTSDTWEFHTYVPEGIWRTASADINIEPPEQVENLALDWDDEPLDVTGNELTWDASADDGAGADDTEYYEVYRAEDEDGPWDETNMIDVVEADGSEDYTYLDEGRAYDGTQWNYVVRAVDRIGNREMNEDQVSELALPEAEDPDPEDGEGLKDFEQTVSAEVSSPNGEPLDVEIYHGTTREVLAEYSGIVDETVEADYPELSDEDMGKDHYWFIVATYEDYNMGSISPVEYSLNVETVGDGTVEIDPETEGMSYLEGTEVELEAIPEDDDWEFVEWTGDHEGTEEEITLTMDSDKDVTAHFEHVGELEGEWRWLYDADHRPDEADNALAAANPQVWYGSMILDLSDDVGGFISEVAYFDYDDTANYVQAHVAEDDGGAPGEWIASSEEYSPVGQEQWSELELTEEVPIEDPGEYWIVLEMDDPADDDEFVFGTIDPDVPDGSWINFGDPHNPDDWDDMGDDIALPDTTWGLEAYIETPVDSDSELREEPMDEELMGGDIDVAVVDEENWQDNEVEYKLEDYLDDDYNVDTLEADELLDEMDNYQVFVIQRFGSDSLAEDFQDELEGQGVVYLDTNQGGTAEAYSDGVYRLNNVRNDPEFRDEESLDTDPPQYLEILEDHPIFEDVGEQGDEVLMFDGATNWGSIFDDYSGEIIGEKDYGGGFEGPAVGHCEEKNEVLLPAKGIGFFGEANDPGWTEEANQMFANSVEYVAGDIEFEPMGWHFHLIDQIDPVADAGEDIEADQGDTITLDGTESTDNVGIDEYEWVIEDPTGEETVLYGPEPEITLEYALTYEVTLTVYDEAGNYDTDSIEIYAIDTEDPIADAGESDQTRAGIVYSLDGSGSTDNVEVVDWDWTIEGVSGDAEGYYDTAEGEIVDYVFPEQGTYEVELETRDAEENSDTDQITMFVNPPVDAFEIISPEEDYEVIEQNTVTIEWEGHDHLEDMNYEIRINYGDWDDIGSDTDYTFVNLDDDTHVVQVRATDSDGNRYTETRIFEISTIEEELEITSPSDRVESLTYNEEFKITGETDPELDLNINGESVSVDENGEFEYETDLVEGQNLFMVQAINDGEIVVETDVFALYLPQIPEMQDDMDDLEDEIANNRDAIDDLEDVTDQLEIDISDLEDALYVEIDELENALEENVSALEDAIDENKTELIDIIEDNIDELEGDIDDINDEISDIHGELEDLNAMITDLEDEIDVNKDAIDDLEDVTDQLEIDLGDLEDDLYSEIEDLETELEDNVLELEDAISDNKQELLDVIEDEIGVLEDDIGEINDEINDIQSEIQLINSELDNLGEDLDDLESKVEDGGDDDSIDIEELENEIEDLRVELESRMDNLENDVENIDLDELENDMNGRIDEVEADLAELEESQDDDIDSATTMGIVGIALAAAAIAVGAIALVLVLMKKDDGAEDTEEDSEIDDTFEN